MDEIKSPLEDVQVNLRSLLYFVQLVILKHDILAFSYHSC